MSRLKSMSRFEEPENEAKPDKICENCGDYLFIGDTVYLSDNRTVYCSPECFTSAEGEELEL